jgi:uncharacterized protein YfaS (alpha-2-macroglobulin family)
MKTPAFFAFLASFFHGLSSVLAALFGRIDWQPPPWARWFGTRAHHLLRWAAAQRLAATALLLVLFTAMAGLWYGWHWYSHRPVPHTVAYQVEPPVLTDYTKSPVQIAQLRVRFAESVAPLAQVGKAVTSGLQMRPEQPGGWRWSDDRTLEFLPQSDWPVGGIFTLDFARKRLLAKGVLLRSYHTSFPTAPFTATISKAELYQDPVDTTLKKLVATIAFSHPVDAFTLERAINLKLGEGLTFRDSGKAPWSMVVDKNGLHAHIHSAPLAVPLESVPLTLTLAKGIKASRGGDATAQALEQTVTVPGRYRLRFSNIAVHYVNNQQGEPQQVLMFDSAFPVADEIIAKHVHAWLLPKTEQHGRPARIPSEDELQQIPSLPLSLVGSTDPLNTHHSFTFQAPVKRHIYVKIDPNIEAVGGYLSKKAETALLFSGEYPKVLQLMGDGALLSLSGEKRIGFMAQGMPGIKVEIARLLPSQLHQLVDQNRGKFARPSVYDEDFDRLVERMAFTRNLGTVDPAKPFYDSVDLSSYLDAQGGRRGVFVLRLTPFDSAHPHRSYTDYPQGKENGDRRCILVTDLGIISKRTLDGGQEVFVQSVADGTPVHGAKVQILGRNGLPVAEALTDSEGHARFPQMNELRREKTPIMLVASLNNDFSFLPLGRSEHQVNFTRFDIGGAANQSAPDQVSAYLFTDRGLYRPGETAHIGFILRTADWNPRISGMPMEIEIRDPRGTVAWNQRRALPPSGMDAIDFVSNETAPTGEYTASIYLIKNNRRNQYLGSTTFKVQEFEPDRMKVTLRLAAAATDGWLQPDRVKAVVTARHLFGADAANRRVTARMQLSPALPAFTQYPQYRFHVTGVLKNSVDEELTEAKTDARGEAALSLNLGRFADSTYRLHLTTQVYEAEGGRNVAAEQELLVSGAPFLVGVATPDPLDYVSMGAVRTSRWLAVGPDLQPLTTEKLRLALIEYRYVSVLVRQDNGTYKYESRRKQLVRRHTEVSLPREGFTLPLPTDEPGDFAYELRDAADTVLNRVTWTVAGTGNLSRSLERNAELQLRLDKTEYAPGDTIQLNIRAPYTGAGLITIERDRVYAHKWFKADTTSSVQTITVPRELEGNGYVTVQFVRDPNSPEVFMSPLSSGVAPFRVSLEDRTLELSLETPALIEPGQVLQMHLTADDAAQAVVFAVDEGILQVARYKTPNPLGHFFRKRALQVETSQILSLILPEFSRLLNAAAAGGDGEEAIGAHLNPFKRKRQGPVAYWSGIVDIPAGGRTFTYTVPDSFNGSLRIMAVAITPSRVGISTTTTEVRGPWVLTPNVPAFVAPGDEFTVSTGLFSNLDAASEVSLTLKPGPGLDIVGDRSTQLQVAPGQEGVAVFRLKALDNLGSADLIFLAESSGDRKARIREAVSVRPVTPYRVALRTGLFTEKGKSLPRVRDLYDAYRKVEIGLGHSPLVWTQGLAAYLEQYPYSCTEQLLSKAMPALIQATPETLAQGNFKPIIQAFSILRQRRNESGGFSQWANNLVVQPEISVYVADFLAEARERGIAVPADLQRQSRAYLERIANGAAEGMVELRNRARAVYLLTRQGVVTTGALTATMEQLEHYHQQGWRHDLAAAYLAASSALLKQDKEARTLIAQVPWHSTGNDPADQETGFTNTYYDALAHDAELLTLTARHFPPRLVDLPESLLSALGQRLSNNQYHTLSAALLIRAFDLYGRTIAGGNGPLDAEVELADGAHRTLVEQGQPFPAPVPQGWSKVILRKENASLPAFYLITEAGFDRRPPAGTLQQGIEVQREYLDKAGKPLSQVTVGQEFTVRLRLRATERKTISEVAIVDLLPGGVEPVIESAAEPLEEHIPAMAENEAQEAESPAAVAASLWEPAFVDTRDDRVVLYATLSRDVATYEYRVRATNAGSFQTPPPYAEGMYDRSLQGRGTSGTLLIVQP